MSERKVALSWYQRVVYSAHCHYRAALRYSQLNYWFGLPSIILATVVGTSVFATLEQQPELIWRISIGLMSIGTAVLSALQLFLNYNDKSEKHKIAGAKYNAIGRELELLLSQNENWVKLEGIRQKIDRLAQESPHIPASIHNKKHLVPEEFLWNQ